MRAITDVVIIGGGPAGLTAALALGRTGREVIIFDDEQGRNFPAAHMMNFPSRDGTPPKEFREQIKRDLEKYREIRFRNERVISLKKSGDHFLVNDGLLARKILLAHGVRDLLPSLPGFKELWGKAVFHCPFCHGHEFKEKRLGIFSHDPNYLHHMIPLILGLTNKVTVFVEGNVLELPEHLKNRVVIQSKKVTALHRESDELLSVELENGTQLEMDGLVIKPPQKLSTDLGINLGCELNELGLYKVDAEGMTTVPGIYAAGDIAEPRQAVITACASGMKTGATMSFVIMNEKLKT